MPSPLTVKLIVTDDSWAAQTRRLVLEEFGARVNFLPITSPSRLVAALSGESEFGPAPHIFICGHGDERGILLEELAEELYVGEPFRDVLTPADVRALVHLQGQAVISTACGSGSPEMASAFLGAGASAFIGPVEPEDGGAAIMFVISLYYWLSERKLPLAEAVARACAIDDETALFRLYE